MTPNPSDDEIRRLLTNAKNIALVGASSSPGRSSHGVMARLLRVGYRVVPVNPNEREVLGQRAVADLAEAARVFGDERIDLVDVFRRPEFCLDVAKEAVAVKAKALWLQQGIVNDAAAELARNAGLVVVQDLCTAVMHSYLRVPDRDQPGHSPYQTSR